jgi:hypothetical protein
LLQSSALYFVTVAAVVVVVNVVVVIAVGGSRVDCDAIAGVPVQVLCCCCTPLFVGLVEMLGIP